jgi:hypothetical protein
MAVATWEHIINDLNLVTSENIVRCCWSCNANKGNRELKFWLTSSYAKLKNINESTISSEVKPVLEQQIRNKKQRINPYLFVGKHTDLWGRPHMKKGKTNVCCWGL